MPARVAEKPGGVVTVRPLRFWSPSFRVRSTVNGLWPGLLPAEAAAKPRVNGRVCGGQGAPSGPESISKNWVALWLARTSSQGMKVASTG